LGWGSHGGGQEEEGGNRWEKAGAKALGHPWIPLLERMEATAVMGVGESGFETG
jgi:hypothetical protein